MKNKTKFNYAVGRYWENNSGAVDCYMYHSEVHHGTMKDAKDFLKYVQDQHDDKSEKSEYKIFMLVEVPQ